MENEGYIIEYRKIGGSVKVSAIDTATMTEVSIIAASGMTKKAMASMAIRKLHYVMGKK